MSKLDIYLRWADAHKVAVSNEGNLKKEKAKIHVI